MIERQTVKDLKNNVGRPVGHSRGPRDILRLLEMRKMRDEGKTFREIGQKFGNLTQQAVRYQIETHANWSIDQETERLLGLVRKYNMSEDDAEFLAGIGETLIDISSSTIK